MTNKLSLSQIDEAILVDNEVVEVYENEVDDKVYRNSFQRKELRTNRQREEGELIGKGSVRKHRKY